MLEFPLPRRLSFLSCKPTISPSHLLGLSQVFFFPKLPKWLGGYSNRFSFHIMRQIIWQGFRSTDKMMRKQVLNLPTASFWGPYKTDQVHKYPILYGFSPSVISPPTDWGANTHVTGYWFLDPPEDWKPPQELSDFIEAGSPPIYIGFGSMSSRNPQETAILIVKALELSKQRGIILSGWGGCKRQICPSPFSWLTLSHFHGFFQELAL